MDVREPKELHARSYALPGQAPTQNTAPRDARACEDAHAPSEVELLTRAVEALIAAKFQDQIDELRVAVLELAGDRWPAIAPERLRIPTTHESPVTLRQRAVSGLQRSA